VEEVGENLRFTEFSLQKCPQNQVKIVWDVLKNLATI
jgi:hypothetical protein